MICQLKKKLAKYTLHAGSSIYLLKRNKKKNILRDKIKLLHFQKSLQQRHITFFNCFSKAIIRIIYINTELNTLLKRKDLSIDKDGRKCIYFYLLCKETAFRLPSKIWVSKKSYLLIFLWNKSIRLNLNICTETVHVRCFIVEIFSLPRCHFFHTASTQIRSIHVKLWIPLKHFPVFWISPESINRNLQCFDWKETYFHANIFCNVNKKSTLKLIPESLL